MSIINGRVYQLVHFYVTTMTGYARKVNDICQSVSLTSPCVIYAALLKVTDLQKQI